MNDLVRSTNPLIQLVLVRLREFFREPEAIFWVLVFPIMLAAGLGIAFRSAPPPVMDVAATTPSLASALRHERMLYVKELSAAEAEHALRTGRVTLVAMPRAGGGVTYRYDGTNAGARTARMLADRAVQRANGQKDVVATQDVPIVERGSRYIDFLLPGLLGMTLMTSALWGVGYTIVDARRKKLMKRLIATPMPRSAYLMSFVIYRLLLMFVEAGAVLAFGILAFGVPVRGSIITLGLICALTTLACTALGLLVAARVRTTEAASGLTNLITMPMWITSGVFFSAQRFPPFVQPALNVLPLTAAINALRANMLEGAGVAQILPEIGVLSTWMVVCFVLALRLFRWR
jgi:ABC-type polysaccharide/polyol phosphate export permease